MKPRRTKGWRRRHFIPIIALLVGAVVLGCRYAGWMDAWEFRTWDWRVRRLAKPGPSTEEICLILVDQDSLDWGQTVNGWPWPWPREVFAALLDFVARADARAVGLDITFSEPSRFGQLDDLALSQAIRRQSASAGVVFLRRNSNPDQPQSSPLPEDTSPPADAPLNPDLTFDDLKQFAAPGGDAPFTRAVYPIAEIRDALTILCNVHQQPDPDGIYRRIAPFSLLKGRPVPTLGLGLYLAASPNTPIKRSGDLIQVGDKEIPISRNGSALLRYRGPTATHTAFRASAILQSEIQLREGRTPAIDPRVFQDRYVLIGYSAPSLMDLRSTPLSRVYPGVEIHATMLDNLLSRDFIRPFPEWATILATLFFAGCAASGIILLNRSIWMLVISLALFAAPLMLALLWYGAGRHFEVMVCETVVLLAVLSGLTLKYALEGRQKRFIKDAFKQYLSPAFIDQLIDNPDRLKLGGERRPLSIFFSDIESFTAVSEFLPPERLTVLLNDYLTAMTDIIIEEGGTVDKYEGDAIMAFWNAPLVVTGHAEKAVRAALRCQALLTRLGPRFESRAGQPLRMRIGINTGEAIVGNFGSQTKFNYTALGDAVNLAARLEGVNKVFGTYTLVSESTRESAGDQIRFREIARVTVVGRKRPVTVFEPMTPDLHAARREIFERFHLGLAAFYNGDFSRAAASFLELSDQDPVAARYHQKCQELIQTPPSGWQGIWQLTRK